MLPHLTINACAQRPRSSDKGGEPARHLRRIVAIAAIGPAGFVACSLNLDYLHSVKGETEAGNTPDATTGSDAADEAPVDGADEAGLDGARDAPLDAVVDAPFCDPMAPDAGTNSILTPDFENSANPGAGWYALYGGAMFSVTSTTAHCGTHSGELSGRTAGYQGIGYNLPLDAATYTVSLWIRQDGNSSLPMVIAGVVNCADAGPTYPAVGYPTVPANTWTHITGTLTIPSACTSVIFSMGQNGSPTTDAGPAFPDLFIDDAYVGR